MTWLAEKRKKRNLQDSLRVLANEIMDDMTTEELRKLAEDQLITVYEDEQEQEDILEQDLKNLEFHLDESGMLINQDGECVNSKDLIWIRQKDIEYEKMIYEIRLFAERKGE